ncbi:hypothetical protein Baya_15952 [Bagarius yarrelli]|uniref:Uncharacterized protein n=1 Tax=Bagarius yarrelli TaxID=175774 RepID=A0A556VTZ5_BAGYA|nr:hypothetical protein Baya_15952 [Bagarius yarrelli]
MRLRFTSGQKVGNNGRLNAESSRNGGFFPLNHLIFIGRCHKTQGSRLPLIEISVLQPPPPHNRNPLAVEVHLDCVSVVIDISHNFRITFASRVPQAGPDSLLELNEAQCVTGSYFVGEKPDALMP